MSKLILFILIFTANMYSASAFSIANQAIQNRLQNALNRYRDKIQIPGMAVSITSLDKANLYHYQLVSGVISRGSKISVTTNSLFQVGSITKSFVAATILKIEASKKYKFNINQPLSKWLPQYPQWGNITIKQLLNHTSGIYNYTETILKNGINKDPSKHWTAEELVAIAAHHPLYFKPGHNWHYSNTNYILAAMIVKAVTGKSLKNNMQNLVASIGLSHTYYIPRYYPAHLLPRMVHGYDLKGHDITSQNLTWASASGALVSNAIDISQWIAALLTPNKVLPKTQLLELQSLVCQNNNPEKHCNYVGMPTTTLITAAPTYSLGLAHYKNIWWHDGSTLGYSAIMLYSAPKKVVVSITADLGYRNITDDFRPLTESMSHILWGQRSELIVQ